MGKIRWLHISDLHYDREMMGDWPVGQNGFPVKNIDFIVFTGDLHTYGRDYNEGKRFLTELAEHYDLNPNEDIFIVPGNHDVDPYRSLTEEIDAAKSEKKRRDAERKAKKVAKAASKSFDDFAIERLKNLRTASSDVLNADGSHLSHRFSEYCEAAELICGPASFSRGRDPFAYAGTFCRKWKNKINLIHVNSALLSCSNTYLAQILDICALNELGHDDAFNRTLPTIILAHHNYAELAAIQREALKPILADLNVRAYLNGDCHRRGEDNILLDGGRAIPCFTAPSIYKAQDDATASIGFYLYEMDTDSPQWRVNVTSYRWIEWRWEIAPCRAIPAFNMRDISTGLHERYAQDVKKLSLEILPGITYQSPDGTVTNEYKNRGNTAPSPMLQLFEEHRDVRHFQLVGKGGSSCGGVGKTSTLLNLAFSLTSSSNAPDIAPLYIQLRRIYGINSKSRNNENRILHYICEEYKITETDRSTSFIFLLDGFNEIPTTTMQIRCLRDILDISDKKYPEAAIILSNRDPLDTYMDLLEYENGFDANQLDRLKFYFHNCYIKELSQEQIDDYFEPDQRCLIPAARNILDTPFYLVLYRQAMQPSGKDAERWITAAFRDHLDNGTPEKTTLMVQMLLREIDNLRGDITSAERELRCFILTKVLPYLGYQMALSSHLDPALTPIKSPNFFRRDAYARTYDCLSAYLPTIDIWNEYKSQNPETLEKPWNTLRQLYQNSNPDISDLTAAIPYTVFPSGLLCHHGRNISFCHDNYRDFFAAFHIANVVYGLYSGIDLAALSSDAQEVFLLQLETLDNSLLLDAISILRQYFGISIYDISAQDTTDLSDTCSQIALPAILIRLLDAVIRRGELSKNEHSQLCQLRSTLCERFVLSFKALDESDPLQTKYCLFFSLALSMLARDYRTGIAGRRDLIRCAGYAQQCIEGEKKLNIPKADGYLQLALCLNARMEDMLNATDTKMEGVLPFSPQLADEVREAVRDYHEGLTRKRDEAIRAFRRNLFPRWRPSLGNVLACCDIFQIMLEAAYEKYVSAVNQNNQNYREIARLSYVSKAYLVLAAIGTSGGALNLLAQMLINQANQYEADQKIPFFMGHPDIGIFAQQYAAPYGWHLNDNYALAYRVLQIVCGIQRGSQPYSHMKKAELVLKGYVSKSGSAQIDTSLNIAINGGLAMGHYWKGRLLLEQAKQDHDRCNDYENAAIVSFCATNVTERFDHLPESADENAVPQLSPPQWLSAIELLRYPDRVDFRVDRRMVFQAIHQNLAQQVDEVQSDSIQIHNERYRLTKKDVKSNLERCLDMVKAQFPDKVPLIQEMIRSMR